jgi:hypothetical protein
VGTKETCVNLQIPSAFELGASVVGPGNGIASKTASHCETVAPISVALSTNLTWLELVMVGSHFEGTATVPSFTCTGKYAKGRQEQLTEDLSGTASYAINVKPPPM